MSSSLFSLLLASRPSLSNVHDLVWGEVAVVLVETGIPVVEAVSLAEVRVIHLPVVHRASKEVHIMLLFLLLLHLWSLLPRSPLLSLGTSLASIINLLEHIIIIELVWIEIVFKTLILVFLLIAKGVALK